MRFYLSIGVVVSILLINLYIVYYTKNKIEHYKTNPPFSMIDFTKSGTENKKHYLKNVLDGDENTFWIKEKESANFDFEIELRLSHYLEKGKLTKKDYKQIEFQFCKNNELNTDYPEELNIELFLREAINVDKELRLPIETIFKNYNNILEYSNIFKMDISNDLNLKDSDKYPENIYIIGIRGKVKNRNQKKSCISEILIE